MPLSATELEQIANQVAAVLRPPLAAAATSAPPFDLDVLARSVAREIDLKDLAKKVAKEIDHKELAPDVAIAVQPHLDSRVRWGVGIGLAVAVAFLALVGFLKLDSLIGDRVHDEVKERLPGEVTTQINAQSGEIRKLEPLVAAAKSSFADIEITRKAADQLLEGMKKGKEDNWDAFLKLATKEVSDKKGAAITAMEDDKRAVNEAAATQKASLPALVRQSLIAVAEERALRLAGDAPQAVPRPGTPLTTPPSPAQLAKHAEKRESANSSLAAPFRQINQETKNLRGWLWVGFIDVDKTPVTHLDWQAKDKQGRGALQLEDLLAAAKEPKAGAPAPLNVFETTEAVFLRAAPPQQGEPLKTVTLLPRKSLLRITGTREKEESAFRQIKEGHCWVPVELVASEGP